MAPKWVVNFSKGSANFTIFRHLTQVFNTQKFLQFSTADLRTCKQTNPVKFTTNKAAEIPIRDIIGFKESDQANKSSYDRYFMILPIGVFLIYFCILREENDIDEILKNPEASNDKAVQLIKLKVKLIYCQSNNLPTEEIKAKIEELEMNHSNNFPFRK